MSVQSTLLVEYARSSMNIKIFEIFETPSFTHYTCDVTLSQIHGSLFGYWESYVLKAEIPFVN